jgi:hypothetical protein
MRRLAETRKFSNGVVLLRYAWADANQTCHTEYGAFVFGGPDNKYMLDRLQAANPSQQDVWLEIRLDHPRHPRDRGPTGQLRGCGQRVERARR